LSSPLDPVPTIYTVLVTDNVPVLRAIVCSAIQCRFIQPSAPLPCAPPDLIFIYRVLTLFIGVVPYQYCYVLLALRGALGARASVSNLS